MRFRARARGRLVAAGLTLALALALALAVSACGAGTTSRPAAHPAASAVSRNASDVLPAGTAKPATHRKTLPACKCRWFDRHQVARARHSHRSGG
jgi:hypothetical protein